VSRGWVKFGNDHDKDNDNDNDNDNDHDVMETCKYPPTRELKT
jgi:hypothetical protein